MSGLSDADRAAAHMAASDRPPSDEALVELVRVIDITNKKERAA